MLHDRLSDEPTLLSVLAVEVLNGTIMSLGPNFRYVSMEVPRTPCVRLFLDGFLHFS